jgi:hypothetical protein
MRHSFLTPLILVVVLGPTVAYWQNGATALRVSTRRE